MANRKLKNFEFANHSEIAKGREINTDKVDFFECENGSVFLICQDGLSHSLEKSPAALASQRIRYYLENEFVESPQDALCNALIYTNGFIYEYGRKNPEYANASVHCSIILIRNGKVWYATLGQIAIFFFNGKKLFLISRGVFNNDTASQNLKESNEGDFLLLGNDKIIEPEILNKSLVPLNGDMLLLASRGFFNHVNEKSIAKILADPMPVQTKLYRLIDMASVAGSEDTISIQLLSFYNLDHTERLFVAVDNKKLKQSKKSAEVIDTGLDESDSTEMVGNTYSILVKNYLKKPSVKYGLLLLFVVMISYMVYDIFIRDPMPPVRISVERTLETPEEAIPSAIPAEEADDTPQPETVISVPEDRIYLVRSGDTWGRIYNQYRVCSWFIRNHPPNAGKFDNDDNPVAGTRINIPVIYSASPELNPNFYSEFSIQKTGSRCENANEAFLESFKQENF